MVTFIVTFLVKYFSFVSGSDDNVLTISHMCSCHLQTKMSLMCSFNYNITLHGYDPCKTIRKTRKIKRQNRKEYLAWNINPSAFPCKSESLPTCCRLLTKHRIAMARQSKTRNPIMPPTMYRVVSSVSGAAIGSCLVEPEVHMNMSCLFYGFFYFHFIC
jgi:transcriptional antiterminator Rof (Rho-off)